MSERPLQDGCLRGIDYLRLSVTDRCNLRCVYCMPAGGLPSLPHDDILSYEELLRLGGIFAALGVTHIRLTGGEPLVRRGLPVLVAGLKALPGVETVSLTTNGLLLTDALPALVAAGLDGVNISLDALSPAYYRAVTRGDGVGTVLAAIDGALAHSLSVKLNCVPLSETRSEWVPLAELARGRAIAVRFIELMPIGAARGRTAPSEGAVRDALESALGALVPDDTVRGSGPGRYFAPAGFLGRIGFISALSHGFCGTCNRARITSTGFFKPCLQYEQGVALKPLLGGDDGQIVAAIQAALREKPSGHHFSDPPVAGDELRGMAQIGG